MEDLERVLNPHGLGRREPVGVHIVFMWPTDICNGLRPCSWVMRVGVSGYRDRRADRIRLCRVCGWV
eukprot:8593253-Prorocentrum_lima.AAC.1